SLGVANTDSVTAAAQPHRVGASRKATTIPTTTAAAHSHGDTTYSERFSTLPTWLRPNVRTKSIVACGASTNWTATSAAIQPANSTSGRGPRRPSHQIAISAGNTLMFAPRAIAHGAP